MSADREQLYEQRQMRRGVSSVEPQEQSREATIKYVVQTTKELIDAYVEQGFDMNAAIMLTSQVLPKLL